MQRLSDRWVSITLSVLLHTALLGALAYGWLLFRQPPRPEPTLAIEARVVDARSVRGRIEIALASPASQSILFMMKSRLKKFSINWLAAKSVSPRPCLS